jgi:Flp pilus assembly protein protease CpaA
MITAKKAISYLGIILLLVAAYGDITTLIIPNLLVTAVALLGIIRLIVIGNIKFTLYTVGVSLFVLIAGTVIFAHGLIGGGDVKLITAVTLLIGYLDSIRFLPLLLICGAVEYVIVVTAAGAAIPFGVAIAIAGSIMLLIRPTTNETAGESAPASAATVVRDPLPEAPVTAVDVESIDPKSVEPKPNPKLNFVSKHWRGEYSLSRSFWVHGVLLGYLSLAVISVLMEIGLYAGSPFFGMIGRAGMIGIGIWQIGGVWRSAKRHGGFWATTANFSIVVILLGFMSNVAHHLRRLEIEHQRASSTPAASPPINPAAYTQPWKQVGEWEVRYDSLDAGDGTASGCFMVRAYGNSALRIGAYGDSYYVLFTSGNLNSTIEDRKHYTLSLSFGELTPWTIKAVAKTFASGIKSLVFHTSDQRFFEELVSSNSVTISQSGTTIFEFTVTGAKGALAAMLNCQEAHLRNPNKSS